MSLEQESRGTRFAGIELALAIAFAFRKSYFVPESRTTASSVAGYHVGAKGESGQPAGFIGSVMVSRLRLHHVGGCQNCLQTDEAKECGFPTCPILTLLEWRRRRQGASFRSMRPETSMFSHRGYGGAAAPQPHGAQGTPETSTGSSAPPWWGPATSNNLGHNRDALPQPNSQPLPSPNPLLQSCMCPFLVIFLADPTSRRFCRGGQEGRRDIEEPRDHDRAAAPWPRCRTVRLPRRPG